MQERMKEKDMQVKNLINQDGTGKKKVIQNYIN